MLKLLRKKRVAKRIFYVLAALIIPAFVIWGSSSVLDKDKTPKYAGMIFGKKVSFDEFRDALYGWKIAMKLQFGDKANEVMNSYFDPSQAAWDRLILLHEAKVRRIKVDNSAVVKMITEMPFLQKDGKFDPQNYDLFLKYSLGESAHVFEEKSRQNIAMSKIYEKVTNTVVLSDDEVRKEYENQNIQTRVAYVFFPSSGYKNSVSITEAEEKSYFDKNRDKFKVPPQVNAEYAAIEFKEDSTSVQKEQGLETIKKLAATARSKGLGDAAKTAGIELKETGLFGLEDPLPSIGWLPQLSSALFDLPQGALSKIMDLERGVYLFEIKEKKNAYLPELAQIKEKVKDKLMEERSKEIANKKAIAFIESLKSKSISFEKAAESQSAEIKETPFFNREGYIPELGMAEALKEQAFKLDKGQTAPKPIELEQGYYCIKSIETQPVDEDKYKKEKQEFSKTILDQKKNKAFSEFFEGLKKKAGLVSYLDDYRTLPR